MKIAMKSADYVNLTLHILGFSLCILPPTLCTLMYFPIWNYDGGARTLAGGCALLLVLCFQPLMKHLRKMFATAASYVMWLFIFVVFLLLSRIAEEMTVISFFGFVGNLFGAVVLKWAKMRRGVTGGEQ